MSALVKEKAEHAKAYIEKKYQKLKTEERERKEGKARLLRACSVGHPAEEDEQARPK